MKDFGFMVVRDVNNHTLTNGIAIKLGGGNVLVGTRDNDLILVEDNNSHPVGVLEEPLGVSVDTLVKEGMPFAIINFKNEKSLDVIISALLKIKENINKKERTISCLETTIVRKEKELEDKQHACEKIIAEMKKISNSIETHREMLKEAKENITESVSETI